MLNFSYEGLIYRVSSVYDHKAECSTWVSTNFASLSHSKDGSRKCVWKQNLLLNNKLDGYLINFGLFNPEIVYMYPYKFKKSGNFENYNKSK